MPKPLLTIELVPKTSFYANVRSLVSKSKWDELRKESYRKANYVCEICEGVGERHPVECHEVWDYNDEESIQTLVGLISLCPKCHSCKHIGFAYIQGKEQECAKHLMKINGMDNEEVWEYIAEAFLIWRERSDKEWELDISLIGELI